MSKKIFDVLDLFYVNKHMHKKLRTKGVYTKMRNPDRIDGYCKRLANMWKKVPGRKHMEQPYGSVEPQYISGFCETLSDIWYSEYAKGCPSYVPDSIIQMTHAADLFWKKYMIRQRVKL